MPFDCLLLDPLNIRGNLLIPNGLKLSDIVDQFIEGQNYRDPEWHTLLRTALDNKPGEDWQSWVKRNEKEKLGNVYPLLVGNLLVVCFEFFLIHIPPANLPLTGENKLKAAAIATAGKVPIMIIGGMAAKQAGASCPEGAL